MLMTSPTTSAQLSSETASLVSSNQSRRSFRFGTGIFGARSRAEYLAHTRKVEDLGYAVFGIPDHFGDQFAPLTALMAAVDATRTLRLGTYVCANDFHHPVVLAKEAATLDLLSEGRLELGLGTGYAQFDYGASGIPLDPPGVRVSRLEEAVQIIKGLFADGPVTFSGTYYTITDLEGSPKPAQRPRPPLFIGGSGKRLLSLAAREADIVGLVMSTAIGQLDFSAVSSAATAQQVEWVRQAAGERFASLELNTLVFDVVITDERQSAAEQIAPNWGTTPKQLLDSVHFLIGTGDQIVETIQMWRERFGISYVTVFPNHMETFAPIVARLTGR
jgi:probable F420-dependent oxidoreductase